MVRLVSSVALGVNGCVTNVRKYRVRLLGPVSTSSGAESLMTPFNSQVLARIEFTPIYTYMSNGVLNDCAPLAQETGLSVKIEVCSLLARVKRSP